ncbi:MAG: O-antigen ligase family protein [Chloroflexi bacterium]|nr:O-antigen ligase family protein [Chloroflexota bacterium]
MRRAALGPLLRDPPLALGDTALLLAIWVGSFLVLLTPLVVSQDTLFPYVVGKALFARSLIEVVTACWLLLALRNPHYRPSRSWLLGLFALYFLVSLGAAVAGVSFQHSFWGDFRRMGGVFDLAHWFAFTVVLSSVVRGRAQWRWLLNANVGVSFLVALIGLAQHYNWRVFSPLYWYLRPTDRLDVTLGNPTYVGAYMLVNLFLALALLSHSFQARTQPLQRPGRQRGKARPAPPQRSGSLLAWRTFWASAAAADVGVLALSGTRGAAVGLGVGLLLAGAGYVAWGQRRRLRGAVGAGLAALVLLALLAPVLHDLPGIRQLMQSNVTLRRLDSVLTLGTQEASLKARLDSAAIGLAAFADAPVLGWGPENFAVAFDRYATGDNFPEGSRLADQAHNKPLEELATRGMLGFLAYVLLLGRAGWVLLRALPTDPRERSFNLFLAAAFVGYLVQDLFLFDTPATFLQLIVLLAWVASREAMGAEAPATSPNLAVARAQSSRVDSSARKGGRQQRRAGGGALGQFSSWTRDRLVWTTLSSTVAAALFLLLGFSLYFLNYRPYRAARLFPVGGVTLDQFVKRAQDSFRAFPPLATLPRQVLLDTLGEHWRERVSPAAAPGLLDLAQTEALGAIRGEPQNPRLYLALAHLYDQAAAAAPVYLQQAEEYLDKGQALAPQALETQRVLVEHKLLAKEYDAALSIINSYVGAYPQVSTYFNTFRAVAEAQARQNHL